MDDTELQAGALGIFPQDLCRVNMALSPRFNPPSTIQEYFPQVASSGPGKDIKFMQHSL